MNRFESPKDIASMCATYFDEKRETLVDIRRAIVGLKLYE